MGPMKRAASQASSPDYAPSWPDRFFAWLERLPWPLWVSYPALFALNVGLAHSPVWVDRVIPAGHLEPTLMLPALWFVLQGGLVHYLDHAAAQAAERFKVGIEEHAERSEGLSTRLQTMPARPVAALSALVIVSVTLVTVTNPQALYPEVESVLGRVLGALSFAVGFLFAPILFYHTVRQLRIVSELYSLVGSVNLFDLEPLYSLSGLTARTGMGWILVLSLNLVQNALARPFGLGFGFLLVSLGLVFFSALAAFLLPLLGIHGRLAEEKSRLVRENARRLRTALNELHQRADGRMFEEFAGFKQAIEALILFNDEIKKVPTWPWQPAIVRAFASALILPLVIFVVQQVISRIL